MLSARFAGSTCMWRQRLPSRESPSRLMTGLAPFGRRACGPSPLSHVGFALTARRSIHHTIQTIPTLAHGTAQPASAWRPASSGLRAWVRSFSTKKPASPRLPASKDEKKKEKKAGKKGMDWAEAKRLIALARPEAKSLGVAVLLLCVSSAITMSVPFSMGKIIDIVTAPTTVLPFHLGVTQFFVFLGGVFTVGAAANMGRVVLMKVAGERIVARLRVKMYSTVMRQDMSYFDANRSGDLISRLSSDTGIVGKALSANVSDGLRSLATSVAGLSMMVYVSGKLTAVMMVIVPPIAIMSVVYGRYVKDLSRQTQGALGDITKVAEERIGNIRTVQAFARETDEIGQYSMRVQEVFALARREALASGFFFGGAGLSGNLTILAVLGMGGNMVMHQAITVGELTSFLLYTAYVGSSLMGLTSFWSEFMKGVGASSRVFELLDRETRIKDEGGREIVNVRGQIRFEDVHFAYPSRPDAPVFKGLSFTMSPDTVMAIAGSSGGGKSTIASLLLRYYDPQQGRILVDGVDVRELNLGWWRRHVGIVSQEPVLFAGTIAENIAYGRSGSTEEEMKLAAEQANCSFIHGFPEGFDTYVGERGVSLSGGQKQRIAIARALLKNPTLLILDEATSALDAESEHLVQEALDRLTRNRTVVTIAHRPSTLSASDEVLCLKGGRVAEQGPFAQLMNLEDGIFRNLMEHQLVEVSSSSDEEEGGERRPGRARREMRK